MSSFNGPKTDRQQQAAAAPRSNVGDEVYFHMRKRPVSGKVLSVGEHGCTVERNGQRIRVKHHHIVGCKKRSPMRYHVVENGEDGLIVRDQNGAHKYIGIPPEARQESLQLQKSRS